MENIGPLIIILIFLLISGLTKKKKAPNQPGSNQQPSPASQSKPADLESILGEFFGKRQDPVPQFEEEYFDEEEPELAEEREKTALERAYSDVGTDYSSFESEKNEESIFQQYLNKTQVGDDYDFSGQKRQNTVFEEIDENDYDEILDDLKNSEISDMQEAESLDDFSGRDAIIYSEIIKRKYS